MSKRETFVAFGDNHGDKIDKESEAGLLRFLDKYPCDHRIHLGDCFDLRSIRQGATGSEEDESLEADLDAGIDFIRKTAPTAFLYGNHEDRLHHIMSCSSRGTLRDYCKDLDSEIKSVLKQHGCRKIYDYHAEDGVHRLKKITFVHARHYAQPGGALIMGHLHSIQAVNAAKHGGAVGFSGGCLCKKSEMRYAKNRLATSKWGSGWLYGFVQGNDWKVWQAHKVGKDFIVSTIV